MIQHLSAGAWEVIAFIGWILFVVVACLFMKGGSIRSQEEKIMELAKRAAAEVRRTKTVYRLDPMPPAERRLVHQALADDPDVETASEGEGPFRKVVVRPKTR